MLSEVVLQIGSCQTFGAIRVPTLFSLKFAMQS